MSGLKDTIISISIVGETVGECVDVWQDSQLKNLEKIKKITITSLLGIMTGVATHYFVEIICPQLSSVTDLVRALALTAIGTACVMCRPKGSSSSVSWILDISGKICCFTGGGLAIIYGINSAANALEWIKG